MPHPKHRLLLSAPSGIHTEPHGLMAKLQWALACQRIIIDQGTNTVSYIDAVEALGARRLPLPFPQIALGTLWKREASGETLRVRVRVLSAADGELYCFEVPPYKFTTHRRYRLNIGLGGFMVAEAGELSVVVEQEITGAWHEKARLPIEVTLEPAGAQTEEEAETKRAETTQ